MLVLPVDPLRPDAAAVAAAAEALVRGDLVIFPTETVYGWAARADDDGALARLRAAKGRDGDRPFTLHLAGTGETASRVLEAAAGPLPPSAVRLTRRFLPGPLTLVLPLPGGGTLGIRIPDDAVARAVLRRASVPVVATSVNRSGHPPCVDGASAARVAEEEAPGATAVLLDAGPTRLRTASTIVRCEGERWALLREGALSAEDLDRA